MTGAFITLRATGERIYLDDPREAQRMLTEDTTLPSYICELCGDPREVHLMLTIRPPVCRYCVPETRSTWRDHVGWTDYQFFNAATAVLRTLEGEVKSGRNSDAR